MIRLKELIELKSMVYSEEIKPKHKKKSVVIFGLKFNGFFELQETLGTFLIDKNIY